MYDVSVIIPNYNGEKFIKEAIDSVLNQAGVNVEVIVVDDGSTDNSKDLLEAYGNRIKVFFQENKGAPAARNLGIKKASADFIKFLDSDDVLFPNVLDNQLKIIKQLNVDEIPYGQAKWVDEKLNTIKGYHVAPIKTGQNPVHHIFNNNPLTSSPLHRKNLLLKIGGFNEALVKGQEFDLHLNLVISGCKMLLFDQNVYMFRQHTSTNRISNLSIADNYRAIFLMILNQEELISTYDKTLLNSTVGKQYLKYGKAILKSGKIAKSLIFFYKWIKLKIQY